MHGWGPLALLFLIAAVNYADRTALSSVFPLVRQELGLSDVGLAAIGSLFLWSYAAGSPFAGLVADRMRRGGLIVWSLLAWSTVTLATALARTSAELLLARVLLGFAECAYLPAANAFLADRYDPKNRATVMGIHAMGLSAGLVAGGLLLNVHGRPGDQRGQRDGEAEEDHPESRFPHTVRPSSDGAGSGGGTTVGHPFISLR